MGEVPLQLRERCRRDSDTLLMINLAYASLSSRLKDLLGPVTRVKKRRLLISGFGCRVQRSGQGVGVDGLGLQNSLPPRLTPCTFATRCLANMAHIRQSRPDYGLGFQVKGLATFEMVPSWLGSSRGEHTRVHDTHWSVPCKDDTSTDEFFGHDSLLILSLKSI